MALKLPGFQAGKAVLALAIGGSVGNAVTQLAPRITNHTKSMQADALGFDEVIDISCETLSSGVRRITGGNGVDIVIGAIGGKVLGEALATLATGASLSTLGYSAGRKITIGTRAAQN